MAVGIVIGLLAAQLGDWGSGARRSKDRSVLYSVQPHCGRHLICPVRTKVCLQNYLLHYHAARSGNFLRTFRDNMTVPSSGVNLKMRPIGCPETYVRNYHYSPIITQNSAVLSYLAAEA